MTPNQGSRNAKVVNASLKKIGWILLLVILLPALAYSVYEVSSLNQNETAIADIYARQLDAFLFSVNQYSDDVAGSWAGKVEAASQSDAPVPALQAFLAGNLAIAQVFVLDSTGRVLHHVFRDSTPPGNQEDPLAALFLRNRERLDQLKKYARAGYRKIDGGEDPAFPGQAVILFVSNHPDGFL